MYILYLYYACYFSPRSLWITRREEGPLCPPVCKLRSWRAHIQEHGNDIEAQDLWWSFIVYKTVMISGGCKTMLLEKAPVKAKNITARPPPADTSQSQKKIFLWQKKIPWHLFLIKSVQAIHKVYPGLPGTFQTGRCIWAPRRSQDPAAPSSLKKNSLMLK